MYDSTFYDNRYFFNSLRWDDIFASEEEFADKIVEIGGITDRDELYELYELLSLKYVSSTTRYTSEFPFIMAIKRQLHTIFPFYLERRDLVEQMREIEISEIMKDLSQIRNVVDTHDEPISNADTVPISDLSTSQETINITGNKLDAILQKYAIMNRDYISEIYKACNGLFKQVLSDDVYWLYPQGE